MSRPDSPAPAAPASSAAGGGVLLRFFQSRESSVVLVLAALCVWLFFVSRETFYSPRNLQNLMLQIALLSIFAIGETVVIITGGIDLSLGSIIAFSGMVLALTATGFNAQLYTGVAVMLAIALALLASFAVGSVHAALVHRLRLPPFVVTLAALTILRSQSLLLNKQLPITLEKFPFLLYLANGKLFPDSAFPIPIPVVILAVIAVAVHLFLSRTTMGRHLYSLGSNEQATRLSGVNVGRVKWFAYGTSAVLGGIAGILYAGYGGQGDPRSGEGYELNAVAAAVIGGANLMGGQGSVGGTLLGACLLRVILSGINLTIANPSLWEGSVVGSVLLMAVLTAALRQRERRASR